MESVNFGMTDSGIAGFGMVDFDMSSIPMFADENAPDAFQWFDESLTNDVLPSISQPEPAASPFQADLDIMDNLSVPSDQKKWMFDVIFNDVIPYRYHDHFRLFPSIDFYHTLFYNRSNRDEIWGFVARFHDWISSVAASSSDDADKAIESLELRALFHGWPGESEHNTSSATRLLDEASMEKQQATQASQMPSAVSTPSDMLLNRKRSVSQISDWTEHQHPILKTQLEVAPTFQYRGIIQNMERFKELDDAYDRHLRRAAGAAPEDDPSWPASPAKQQAYVRKLFESATDLSDFFELRKARERLNNIRNIQQGDSVQEAEANPRKRRRALNGQPADQDLAARPKGMSKSDWALLDAKNTPVDLLEAVVHHRISSIEIEILCWKLLCCAMEQQQGFTMRPLWSGTRTVSTWEHFDTFSERWQAICDNIQDCKMIIHSLTRADWFCKYAGAPSKERGAKLSNDLLNGRRDIQNQVGRDIIKERTSQQEWVASESFEIRDRHGDLISKGGHLGDIKRRQLAVRDKGKCNRSS
ncbi:hypothetical protein CSPX01_14763 [Colletotrichum filicis]|nr:hypothetical protein CSPX01_14763 [Colletotrichum filicis]